VPNQRPTPGWKQTRESNALTTPRRPRKPRLRSAPTLEQQGLVDVDGVICRPDAPRWWLGETESAAAIVQLELFGPCPRDGPCAALGAQFRAMLV